MYQLLLVYQTTTILSISCQNENSDEPSSVISQFTDIMDKTATVSDWFFNIKKVEKVVGSLKFGKASGADGITTEHLRYAHPSIVFHLKSVFNLILLHGYVPNDFGRGIIVPLVKDRHDDCGNLDNYRGITVSSIISKVFELCVCDKFGEFLSSHALQFGYKKNTGCQNAVFTLQKTVNYFTQRGSTVFVSCLDASKAFDRISHVKLFEKLIKRQVPSCLICVLCNWYSKLYSCVRWNGT